jgi:hypothetical protein
MSGKSNEQPRQCRRCGRWFYDSPLYREGSYGCRYHGCDETDYRTRFADGQTVQELVGEIKAADR